MIVSVSWLYGWFPPRHPVAVIILVSVCAFGACLLNGFVADDFFIVLDVPAYQKFDLGAIVFGKANTLEYLPVRDISLALDAAIWGENAMGFHLSNLLLYLIGLPLIYRVARSLAGACAVEHSEFVAFWATLIFALHPLQAEAVNFISARNNILALLFLMLSLYWYLEGCSRPNTRLLLSLVAFVLALLSKASVVFYPIFLTALVLVVPALRMSWRFAALSLLPFLLVDAGGLWLHLRNASDAGVIHETLVRFGGDSLALTLARVTLIPLFYLKQLLFPYPLTILYPNILPSSHVGLYAVGTGLGLVALVLLVWRCRRRSWLPVVGLMWLLLSLGPVMNIFPTVPVVADRYAYPAVFGFGVLCAWLMSLLPDQRQVIAFACCVAAVCLGLDVKRTLDWRSDLSLYQAAYAAYADPARPVYAKALFHAGDKAAALALYADVPDPGYDFYYMRGRWLAEQGRKNEAIASFQRARRLGGNDVATVHLALAEAYESSGDLERAIAAYLSALEAERQDLFSAYRQSAQAALDRLRRQLSTRRSELRSLAESEPGNVRAQFEFAVFLQSTGEYDEAGKYYRRVAVIDASLWEPWYNLGVVELKLSRYAQAREAFLESLKRRPGDARTMFHLGLVSERLTDDQAAISYYRDALEADGTYAQAALALGQMYYRKGDNRQALIYFQEAGKLVGDDQSLRARINSMVEKLK